MALSKEDLERTYSSLPHLVKPPEHVWVLENATIGARHLHEATQGVRRDGGWHIYGMHRVGSTGVVLAGDAPPRTAIHEAGHARNIPIFSRSEVAQHATAPVLAAYAMRKQRIQQRHRWMRRPHWRKDRVNVKYQEVPVTDEQRADLMRAMHLSNASDQSVMVRHYVLVSPPPEERDAVALSYHP